MLTLEQLTEKTFLVRLENINLTQKLSVSVSDRLAVIGNIDTVTEMTLDGFTKLQDVKRLQWKTELGSDNSLLEKYKINSNDIELEPKQIRTFVVKMK